MWSFEPSRPKVEFSMDLLSIILARHEYDLYWATSFCVKPQSSLIKFPNQLRFKCACLLAPKGKLRKVSDFSKKGENHLRLIALEGLFTEACIMPIPSLARFPKLFAIQEGRTVTAMQDGQEGYEFIRIEVRKFALLADYASKSLSLIWLFSTL